MGANRIIRHVLAVALAVVFACVAGAPLHSQSSADYFFELQPDGSPRFTQVLRWQGDPAVLYYHVTLQRADGTAILATRVTEPVLRFSLPPGEYRYHIVYFNLLRQPEIELPWQTFSILKAEIPRIARTTPQLWFIEDGDPVLTIEGQDLMPGASVELIRQTGAQPALSGPPLSGPPLSGPALSGMEQLRLGTRSVTFQFPAEQLEPGVYAVTLANPGGLRAQVEQAVVMRNKLPPPQQLTPPPGVIIGPSDLRTMERITFSWTAVPEATHYRFALRNGTNGEAVFSDDTLTELRYVLTDLSLLDRGEFHWTVEAVSQDGDLVTIPSARAAQATFTINLPELQAPTVYSGDTFYGWK